MKTATIERRAGRELDSVHLIWPEGGQLLPGSKCGHGPLHADCRGICVVNHCTGAKLETKLAKDRARADEIAQIEARYNPDNRLKGGTERVPNPT